MNFFFVRYRTSKQLQDPFYWLARNADKLIIGFVCFSIYLQDANKFDATNINNISGFLFMNCMSPGFGAVTFVPSIVLARTLFNRERSDGAYLSITYVIWKLLEEMTMAAFSSIIWTGTVYYSIGFVGNFGNFYLNYYLLSVCSVSFYFFLILLVTFFSLFRILLFMFIIFGSFLCFHFIRVSFYILLPFIF